MQLIQYIPFKVSWEMETHEYGAAHAHDLWKLSTTFYHFKYPLIKDSVL